jgi:DNA repair exonuclease SbcCD nuclease subunit
VIKVDNPETNIKVVHSSDLHITGQSHQPELSDTKNLSDVLTVAKLVSADLILLAGDVFEHNRLSLPIIEIAYRLIESVTIPIVILPGNHDPLTDDSVYRRGALSELPHVNILGLTHEKSVSFDDLQLDVWGNAHRDYSDMQALRDPPIRKNKWQVAMAHAHYNNSIAQEQKYRPSWLINDEDILKTGADYVALGHWNISKSVGNAEIPAHYSGSPDHECTVNVIEFFQNGPIEVTRISI